MVYEFDVAVSTHDHLKQGIVVAQWRRVSVEARDYAEASLLACQLAAAGDGVMATDLLWRL